MMSLKSKRELLEVTRPRYLQANKVDKQKILDEFTAVSGYHRKHAIRVLNQKSQAKSPHKRKPQTYSARYRGEVVLALKQIWGIFGHLCSKRLQPYLPEAIRVLEDRQEMTFTPNVKSLLLTISSASIDRCLRPVRIKTQHGLSTTKPGQYLNTLTCIDLAAGWTEITPILHRSQHVVAEAVRQMRQNLPFPLLGIASDIRPNLIYCKVSMWSYDST